MDKKGWDTINQALHGVQAEVTPRPNEDIDENVEIITIETGVPSKDIQHLLHVAGLMGDLGTRKSNLIYAPNLSLVNEQPGRLMFKDSNDANRRILYNYPI